MTVRLDLPDLDLDLDLEALERAVALTPSERVQRVGQNLMARLRRAWVDVALVTGLLVLAGAVQARGMYVSPARFDDEGTYTAYAWAVQNLHELAHYTYWYAHPPLGQLQMAFYNVVTGAFDRLPYAVASGRELALVCKLISVVLLYQLGRRLGLARATTALAVLMFSLSPLAVYFHRTALLDNLVTPWLLAAFCFAASPRRSIGAAAASAACFATAVLTKETALLFMPAVVLLFWQHTDRRNRKFTVITYLMVVSLLGLLYPLYALIKNELWAGPGHVSLQWAIQWQLFDRAGSGSIFDPHSNAHAVVTTWLTLDGASCLACLLALVPGLLLRRTRAVAIAFGVQVSNLLRSGYLPYPFVIAMIPFALLTLAGVLDVLWRWSGGVHGILERCRSTAAREPAGANGRASRWSVLIDGKSVDLVDRAVTLGRESPFPVPGEHIGRTVPLLVTDDTRTLSRRHLDLYVEDGSVHVLDHGSTNGTKLMLPDGERVTCVPGVPVPVPDGATVLVGPHRVEVRAVPVRPSARRRLAGAAAEAWSLLVPAARAASGALAVAGVVALALSAASPWWYGLKDLQTVDRDAGKAAALAWLSGNAGRDDTLVVDDAFWVDLVRSGRPREKVIWFTKLDVDKDVALPTKDPWRSIDYVLLDHQDTLSVHLNNDLSPSRDTHNQFPTIAQALQHGQIVASFGSPEDRAIIWRVDPTRPPARAAPSPRR